jgi:lipopolysaccharide heptosyltransferase I
VNRVSVKLDRKMPQNILIIKPSALGDVATALPVLATLRANLPKTKISWLVRTEFAPLLEMTPDLDEIILFDRKHLGKWWCDPKVFGELVSFLRGLYKSKYDLVIDLQGLFRTAFFSWITGSKKRFGLKSSRELASIFYTDKVCPSREEIHIMDQLFRIVSKAGYDKIVTTPNVIVADEIQEQVSILLKQNNVADDYAVFIPTAAHDYKYWPICNFVEMASRLTAKFSLKVIATGATGDKAYLDQLVSADGSVINLAGQTDIKQLVGLIKGAKFVLTNDTGPGQIASVLGVPMVMVVGNTNPLRIGTYGRPECIAAIDPDGRCNSIHNPDPKYAIENVTVDMVFEKAVRQIEKIDGLG